MQVVTACAALSGRRGRVEVDGQTIPEIRSLNIAWNSDSGFVQLAKFGISVILSQVCGFQEPVNCLMVLVCRGGLIVHVTLCQGDHRLAITLSCCPVEPHRPLLLVTVDIEPAVSEYLAQCTFRSRIALGSKTAGRIQTFPFFHASCSYPAGPIRYWPWSQAPGQPAWIRSPEPFGTRQQPRDIVGVVHRRCPDLLRLPCHCPFPRPSYTNSTIPPDSGPNRSTCHRRGRSGWQRWSCLLVLHDDPLPDETTAELPFDPGADRLRQAGKPCLATVGT